MKKTLFIILITLFSAGLFGNEGNYTIEDIKYEIEGATQPFFLERRIGINRDIVLSSKEEVEKYRLFIEQELKNLRIYEDLEVTYEIDKKKVTYNIYLDEAWNLVPFPYVKGDTNNGGRIAAKLFWNNSLGTLTNTLFQGGINIGLDPNGKFDLQKWNFSTDVSQLYIGNRAYTLSLEQELTNKGRGTEKWEYYSTTMAFGTSFQVTPIFSYSPKVTLRWNYLYDDVYETIDPKDIPKKPLILSYDHSMGRSQVNWTENFREGYKYSIKNTLSLINNMETESVDPTTNFTISGTYYKILGDLPMYLGVRGKGVLSLNEEMLGLGSNIRGVVDNYSYGYKGAFLNSNIYIRVIKIDGFAEAIFAPSFDIGVTDNSGLDYGTGADFVLYVDKLKSMVARGTLAIDPREISGISDFEDFVKTLEIEVTSSLFF